MKVLCLSLPTPGHIDFGGFGFIKLAQTLKRIGHDVEWYCSSSQIKTINAAGIAAHDHPLVSKATFPSSLKHKLENKYQQYLKMLSELSTLIKHEDPDVVLIDRMLIYAAYIAEDLSIPYIAVGTPGGSWGRKQGYGVRVAAAGDCKIFDFIDSVVSDLNIRCQQSKSIWVESLYSNVCFMGSSFYSNIQYKNDNAIFINHFKNNQITEKKLAIGVSFGNTGTHIDYLVHALRYTSQTNIHRNIEVIAGNDKFLEDSLKSTFKQPEININGWVDFETLLPKLHYLICCGGIGTIWSCVNNNTPMLLVSGDCGDQHYNVSRAADVGIGRIVDMSASEIYGIEESIDVMGNSRQLELHRESIYQFKSQSNYTDDIESAAYKIIAHCS